MSQIVEGSEGGAGKVAAATATWLRIPSSPIALKKVVVPREVLPGGARLDRVKTRRRHSMRTDAFETDFRLAEGSLGRTVPAYPYHLSTAAASVRAGCLGEPARACGDGAEAAVSGRRSHV